MAGITALYASNFNNSSPWYICPNGEFIEPLDVLFSLFPNKGRSYVGHNTCFVPRLFGCKFILQNLLPAATDYYTPDLFIDGMIALMVMSIIVSLMMLFTKEVWSCLDPGFKSIHPSHKKLYVVANLAKAVLLGILTLSPRYWVGAIRFYNDDYRNEIGIKRCVVVYIATDFVALFLVPKLPRSTLFHHITTSVLAVIVTSMNLQTPGWNGLLGVAKMAIIYGLFSSAAFPVNAYLALRVVYPKAKWMPILVHISLWTYILCCIMNWGFHLIWLFRVIANWDFSVFPLLYLAPIYFVVNDDLILIKWLAKRRTSTSDSGKKDQQ